MARLPVGTRGAKLGQRRGGPGKSISELVSTDKRLTDAFHVRWERLTPEERDVRVVGNAYVQFASPLGIEIDAGVKITRVNLRDNESFSMLEAVVKQASDMKP